jgi:hypothetical protein
MSVLKPVITTKAPFLHAGKSYADKHFLRPIGKK